jgi:hypothetical protein
MSAYRTYQLTAPLTETIRHAEAHGTDREQNGVAQILAGRVLML